MVKIKKGMLITLGTVILLLELIALLTIITETSYNQNEIIQDYIEFHILDSKKSIIEQNIFDMLSDAITISKVNNTVTIEDSINNKDLNSFIDKLKNYTSLDNISIANAKKYFINNISYENKYDSIEIINVLNLSINAYFNNNITSCNFDFEEGNINLNINVSGIDSECLDNVMASSGTLWINSEPIVKLDNANITIKNIESISTTIITDNPKIDIDVNYSFSKNKLLHNNLLTILQ